MANVGLVAVTRLWGQIVVLSHLRFAAGVCVLAAGLLIGSAWVATAVANADSSNSAAQGDGGTNASRQGSTTASGPVGHVTHTQRKKIRRVDEHAWLGADKQASRRPLARKGRSKSLAARTPKTRRKTRAPSPFSG